ncbi:protein kinase [Parabacteroides sp. PF5-9]|uniref:protein kinase domain-containing protein n=1 Tax=Parabacteroides sp. PF5-9 TaxID=1742404 RepID=UPI0024738D52|nr:protein kinase [Parabacteroides sp. PF5-9]MDH6356409.1 hypothetical protein [Parabacteroides sp. PF5-9]
MTEVVLKISKGGVVGKTFRFNRKEAIFIGRQDDCGIVLPESTISRYHCLLEINPPVVVIKDLGSLNGTYLNGYKIGQRDRQLSSEEAAGLQQDEYFVHAGDCLRLGKECEIMVDILVEGEEESATNEARELQKQGFPVYLQRRKIKDTIIFSEGEEPVSRKCEICGTPLSGGIHEPNICSACLKNPEKAMDFLMDQMLLGESRVGEIVDYRKMKRLGHGGMGEVWLVENSEGEEAALKIMLPKAAVNENSRNLFLREANIAGQLNHKHIVRQYHSGHSGDTYFILMEYCRGENLETLVIRKGGKLPIEQASEIVLQLLEGLEYAHSQVVEVDLADGQRRLAKGIVHRDLKPSNILLSDYSTHPIVKISDFGLAKAFETAGLSGYTQAGQRAGTPGFMARQQVIDFRSAKPAVDVWAAAATYYFMLTGTTPKEFKKKDKVKVILNEKPIPIRERNRDIPQALAEVIDRALIELPEIGIQSAGELRTRIIAAL